MISCRQYPLVNVYNSLWKITILLMGKLTISMAIFHSYFDITRGSPDQSSAHLNLTTRFSTTGAVFGVRRDGVERTEPEAQEPRCGAQSLVEKHLAK